MNLVGSGLGGCTLFSMGVLAARDGLDLSGTQLNVDLAMADTRIGAIELAFAILGRFSSTERFRLEKAAGLCPIKSSFHPDIPISVRFDYPE